LATLSPVSAGEAVHRRLALGQLLEERQAVHVAERPRHGGKPAVKLALGVVHVTLHPQSFNYSIE
jgi:hypothetical protein